MEYKFIILKAVDARTALDDAQEIWVRPQQIAQFEHYTGPFELRHSVNGQFVPNGEFKEIVNGSLVLLNGIGMRACYDTPAEIIEKIEESGRDF